MARINVETVPPEDRRPDARYQVTVDGSVISRHRTKAQARERARQASGTPVDRAKNMVERAAEAAKIGSPVKDASLEPMGDSRVDEFASAAPRSPATGSRGDHDGADSEGGDDWMMDLVGDSHLDAMVSTPPAVEGDGMDREADADADDDAATDADPFGLGLDGDFFGEGAAEDEDDEGGGWF